MSSEYIVCHCGLGMRYHFPGCDVLQFLKWIKDPQTTTDDPQAHAGRNQSEEVQGEKEKRT